MGDSVPVEVYRISDYERREPAPRDPDALPCVVILPVIRIERHDCDLKKRKKSR